MRDLGWTDASYLCSGRLGSAVQVSIFCQCAFFTTGIRRRNLLCGILGIGVELSNRNVAPIPRIITISPACVEQSINQNDSQFYMVCK